RSRITTHGSLTAFVKVEGAAKTGCTRSPKETAGRGPRPGPAGKTDCAGYRGSIRDKAAPWDGVAFGTTLLCVAPTGTARPVRGASDGGRCSRPGRRWGSGRVGVDPTLRGKAPRRKCFNGTLVSSREKGCNLGSGRTARTSFNGAL